MLTGLCCALIGLALAEVPPAPLRPIMLDAPQEALRQGEALLARDDLDPIAREGLLQDMATAAMLLSPQHAMPIADRLETLGRDSGRPSALALADIVRARIQLEGDQIESGLALASSATAALRALNQPYWNALAELENLRPAAECNSPQGRAATLRTRQHGLCRAQRRIRAGAQRKPAATDVQRTR